MKTIIFSLEYSIMPVDIVRFEVNVESGKGVPTLGLISGVNLLEAPARHWVGRPAKHVCEVGVQPV